MGMITFGFKALGKKRVGRLDKRWDFDAQSALSSPPLVADIDGDGKKEIIFGTKKGKLFVLDNHASIRWFYDSNETVDEVELMFLDVESVSSIEASPNVGDINGDGKNEVVFGTELGVVYVLDEKGQLLWKYKAGGPIRGQVLLYDLYEDDDIKVIFGCGDNKLYVLNSSGKLVWRFDAGSPVHSTPGILHKEMPRIVFGANDGAIFCVNKKGDLAWKFKTKDKVFAQPAIGNLFGDDRVFVIIGSNDHNLYVLDEAGELFWSYKTGGAILAKASLSDINNDKKLEIIFGSCDNNVYALNPYGDKLWSYETDFWVVSEPILEDIDGDGKKEVIIGSYDNNVYVLDSEGSYVLDYMPGLSGVVQQAGHYSDIITKEPGKVTGKKIWQFKVDGVIVGCAYIPDDNSILVSTKKGAVNDLVHKKE
ncbi:MAG TPA: PQQ-binding-like beta-propeller repeat protein [Candidatus Nanoarchaeia archaeon]|nr:PQQ-binding-like beta-propeller repeat protein [Candidatus Nanoarchaeia archaeon]